jgi:DNA-binding Xre family transcriptional regulator
MTNLRVKELAEARGFNILTLSRAAQLSYTSVHGLWHAKADQYNRKTLDRVAATLGVRVSDLFAGDPEDTRDFSNYNRPVKEVNGDEEPGNSLPMQRAA